MDAVKKVVYISGPITGVENYWEAFEQAEDDISACGCIPLSPAKLPEGMTKAQRMRTRLSMIDSADAVLFLHGFEDSEGSRLEREYCKYIDKPCIPHRRFEHGGFGMLENPVGVRIEWLKFMLEEVFGK